MEVRFVGNEESYLIDYTKAKGDGSGYRNVTYPIAIPIGGLKKDEYKIVVYYNNTWMDTKKGFKIN